MKVVAFFANKGERGIGRQCLTSFNKVELPVSIEETVAEIKKPGPLELLILNDSTDTDPTVEALEALAARPTSTIWTVACVILNEQPETELRERQVTYAELGTDFFLHRPYGLQELKEKIEEAKGWILSPPPAVKLVRNLRLLVKQKEYAKAEAGLATLFATDRKNLSVGLLFAECLMSLDEKKLTQSLSLLEEFEKTYPNGLAHKKLIVRALLLKKDFPAALKAATKLWIVQENSENFARCREILNQISDATAQRTGAIDLVQAMGVQASLRNQAQRVELLERVAASTVGLRDVQDFLDVMHANTDVLPSFSDALEKLLARVLDMGEAAKVEKWLYELVVDKLCRLQLETDPGSPTALKLLVDLHIKNREFEAAYVRLTAAKTAKKFSADYYEAATKLSLAEKRLREASENLSAGRRLLPSDDRWDALAAQWNSLRDQLNEGQ